MRQQLLGRTRFSASVLGIGDLADRAIPLADCVATIHSALDYGLNLVDTAPMYEDGYSEAIVGAALKGRREGVFLIDKIDALDEPVAPQVDASLQRLGLDEVDLFAFHAVNDLPTWLRITSGAMDELARCWEAGKVRFRGVSSHSPEVLRAAVTSGLCDVVMFPVGPFVDRRYIEETLPLARAHGVGTVCFKTFGAGKLLGDTTGYNAPLQARPRGKFGSGGSSPSPDAESQLPRLGVAECLHYTLTLGPDVVLLGLSHSNEQDEAFAAFERYQPLDVAQMREVERRAAEAIEGKGPCWWNATA
jgi:aryl-alcohol dehydrogenase-like predicted oxidoreductase